ncbi:MAG: type II toxin-antitoxin system RelE/ParE family toxin, partial [Candidatus Nanoarchaeia archaeon]|nr:type II toxin-antitoxin system RelE/ParE family toxin [Candidatus Nanoarchaeia archaeon]
MVNVSFSPDFEKIFKKINDELVKKKIKKQISKLINNPETGKPMKFARKGTRELYVSPFRLSYSYIKEKQEII